MQGTHPDPSALAWDDVRFFLALVRARTVGEAARALRVDASTVSRRLAAMEAALGVALFARSRDGIEATEAAEDLLPAAEEAERALARFGRAVDGLERTVSGLVRITCPPDMAEVVVLPALAELAQRHPGLRAALLPSESVLDLTRREADLAVRVVRPSRGDLVMTTLGTMRFVAAGNPALVEALGTVRAWGAVPWVRWDERYAGLPSERWLDAQGAALDPRLRSDRLLTQVAAVRAGLGAALLPEPSLAHYGLAPLRLARTLQGSAAPWPEQEVLLLTHRALRDVPRVAAVWDALVARFRTLPGVRQGARRVRAAVGGLAVLLCAALAGCAGDGGRVDAVAAPLEPRAPYCRAADPEGVEARIDGALAALSLEEKVALMAGEARLDVAWPTPAVPALGLPGLGMIDGPRGVGVRSRARATSFPVGILRGAAFRPALEREVGAAIARETRAAGASALLAPTMNVLRHPRWGRAQETYGEDPHHVGALAAAFVEGVQGEGVLATAKHFAANSIENTRLVLDVRIDARTLHEVYLPHFRRVVREAGVAAVMTAYNGVNGAPMSSNAPLVRDVLKGAWGFEGLVVSDWVFGVKSTVDAALAGLDLEMPVAEFFDDDLVRAVEDGRVPAARVDDAVRRVLRAQLCYGLDRDPPQRDPSAFPFVAHAALAREAARRGLVLLRNEGGLVPIALEGAAPLPRLAVVGALADAASLGDDGSSDVDAPYAVTVLAGLRAAAAAAGAPVPEHVLEPLDAGALARVAAADVAVVVVGLGPEDEGESILGVGDRVGLALPRAQDALVEAVAAAARRTVVLVVGSGPVALPWLEAVDALLWVGYPGQEGGAAVADVLFGAVPPSGSLPFSWPAAEADLPEFDPVSTTVTYGPLHGYRHLDATGTEPTFAFGFGLPTSTLRLEAPRAAPTRLGPEDVAVVEVDVVNEGARTAVETVLVFAAKPESALARPARVLVGFDQVEVPPGDRRTARIAVPARALAHYDPDAAALRIERGPYLFELGTSARDLPLTLTVQVP